MTELTQLTQLTARIRRVEDQLELRALVAKYARAVDERDMRTLATLFTQDAQLMTRDGAMKIAGRHAIMADFEDRLRKLGPTNHFCHDHLLEFASNDPDYATGTLSAHAEVVMGERAMLAAIRYEDSYRRTEGRWCFASRMAAYFYFVPMAEFAQALVSGLRMRARGEPRQADYPESLASWHSFYGEAL